MTWTERLRDWARRIKRDGVTLWFAAKHPRMPWYVKALAAFVVAYALSPIDLIPDFIPVLGFVDDALLLPGLIWLAVRLTPPGLLEECRASADAYLRSTQAKPRSVVGAVLVVSVWMAVGVALWRWLA